MATYQNTCGYIRVALALLFTVLAVLWIIKYMFNTRHAESPSSKKASIHNTQSISQKIKTSDANPEDRSCLRKMDGRQKQSTQSIGSTSESILEQKNEQVSMYYPVHNRHAADSVDSESYGLSEDIGLVTPNANGYVQSTSDLAKCIEKLERAESHEMEQSIRELWIVAADLGAPDDALDALEYFIMVHHEANLIELAEFAIEDLLQLLERRKSAPIQDNLSADNDVDGQTSNPDQDLIFDSHSAPAIQVAESREPSAVVQVRLEALSDQALRDSDASRRRDAIRAFSHFRNNVTVDILIQATNDPDPTNRLLALQTLWFSAADGLENEGNLRHYLKQAQCDIDMQVADLATRAIKDLEQLEENRAEAETAISFGQENYYEDYSPDNTMHEIDRPLDPLIQY